MSALYFSKCFPVPLRTYPETEGSVVEWRRAEQKFKGEEEREMARTKPWQVSDELWERVRPLIPARAPHPKGGRPAQDDRQMLEAIVYVLRTGIQWNALPRELAASSTAYDRFRLWESQGGFERLWAAGLEAFDEVEGLDWTWQSLDGTQIKAPDREAAPPAPTRWSAANGAPSAVGLP